MCCSRMKLNNIAAAILSMVAARVQEECTNNLQASFDKIVQKYKACKRQVKTQVICQSLLELTHSPVPCLHSVLQESLFPAFMTTVVMLMQGVFIEKLRTDLENAHTEHETSLQAQVIICSMTPASRDLKSVCSLHFVPLCLMAVAVVLQADRHQELKLWCDSALEHNWQLEQNMAFCIDAANYQTVRKSQDDCRQFFDLGRT